MDMVNQTPESGDRGGSGKSANIIARLLDVGLADRQAQQQLEKLLREDDNALRRYLELMDLDARMRWACRGGESGLKMAQEPATSTMSDAAEVPNVSLTGRARLVAARAKRAGRAPRTQDSLGRQAISRSPEGRHAWRLTGGRLVTALGVAASLAAVVLLLDSIASWSDGGAVGRLTQSAVAEWAEPHAMLTKGQPIGKGQMSLLAGVVEIMLSGDTRLIVEGPAKFEIRSADNAFLESGTASVFVGPSAAGYTLETPDALIQDLGTAFQASIVKRGTEVHVIEGEVLARSTQHLAGAENANELRLSARDAVLFNRRDGSVVDVDFVGERFKLHDGACLGAMPVAVTGDIRCLQRTPASLVVGEFEHDEIILFLERCNTVLPSTLYADRNAQGEDARQHGNVGMEIPAGARVNSYLLHFDPIASDNDNPARRASATVRFRSPIAGVFITRRGLYASDKHFKNPGTKYSPADKFGNRQSEVHSEGDFISFSSDRKAVTVNFEETQFADQIRIVTMEKPF